MYLNEKKASTTRVDRLEAIFQQIQSYRSPRANVVYSSPDFGQVYEEYLPSAEREKKSGKGRGGGKSGWKNDFLVRETF